MLPVRRSRRARVAASHPHAVDAVFVETSQTAASSSLRSGAHSSEFHRATRRCVTGAAMDDDSSGARALSTCFRSWFCSAESVLVRVSTSVCFGDGFESARLPVLRQERLEVVVHGLVGHRRRRATEAEWSRRCTAHRARRASTTALHPRNGGSSTSETGRWEESL